jgi:hypothetical protein
MIAWNNQLIFTVYMPDKQVWHQSLAGFWVQELQHV